MPTTYTPRETAEKIGMSYCYFMRLLKEGKFQHHRLSERHIFFTDEDIESIINSAKVEAKN